MKLIELISANSVVNEILKRDAENKSGEALDFGFAYKLYKFAKEVNDSDALFFQKKQSEIVTKYADKNADGKNVGIPETKQAEYIKEMETLCNIESTHVPDIHFTFAEFEKAQPIIKLKAVEIGKLIPFISEE